jgi:hypothetical protein
MHDGFRSTAEASEKRSRLEGTSFRIQQQGQEVDWQDGLAISQIDAVIVWHRFIE